VRKPASRGLIFALFDGLVVLTRLQQGIRELQPQIHTGRVQFQRLAVLRHRCREFIPKLQQLRP
jgi:hypothetical protein